MRPSRLDVIVCRIRLRRLADCGLAAGVGAQGRHVVEDQLLVARPEPELRPDPDLPRRLLATAQGRRLVLRGLPLLGVVNLLPLPGFGEELQRFVELADLRRDVSQDVRVLRHSGGKLTQVGDGLFQAQVLVRHLGLPPFCVKVEARRGSVKIFRELNETTCRLLGLMRHAFGREAKRAPEAALVGVDNAPG